MRRGIKPKKGMSLRKGMVRSMRELTDQDYEQSLQGAKIAVVEFYSPDCGHCKVMQKVLEKLEERTPETVQFFKIDILSSSQAAKKFDIAALPTFLFLKDGEIKEKFIGEKHELILEQAINKIL